MPSFIETQGCSQGHKLAGCFGFPVVKRGESGIARDLEEIFTAMR
jgi:hypothetical protein